MENSGQQVETNEPAEQQSEFAAVKERLEEIARAVDDENLPLDDALDLYEEAVKLGLKASSLLEVGIVVEEEADPAAEAATDPTADPTADGSPDGRGAAHPTADGSLDDRRGALRAPGSPQASNGNAPTSSAVNPN